MTGARPFLPMIAVLVVLASLPPLALATAVMPPAPPPPIPPPDSATDGVGASAGAGAGVEPLMPHANDAKPLTSTRRSPVPPLPGASPVEFGYDDDEPPPNDVLENGVDDSATSMEKRTISTDASGNSFDHETDAADIMRLMRGGRGRKSVHSRARPPAALRRCYSAEPGGQRGSWSLRTGRWPVWIPNPRCSDLPDFDENRLVQCLLKSASSSNTRTNGQPTAAFSKVKPVWLALVGDASTRVVYECLTGGSRACIDIARMFQSMGYERLVFDGSSSAGQANSDHDTVFWPPKTEAAMQSLPPLRISFRLLKSHRSEFTSSKGIQWNEMLSENGVQHAIENWLSSRAKNTWGEQPTALLFSNGRSFIPSGESVKAKDCSTAKASTEFLRAFHKSDGSSQLLWVTVPTPRPSSRSDKESAKNGPTNQQILWDRECGRMMAKHYRLPFIDATELTEAAWRGDNADIAAKIMEPDGFTLGLPIQQEIIRRWMPQLCQELPRIPEK